MQTLKSILPVIGIAALVAVSAQAQINNNPPGGSGPGRGRGPGVEASVVTAARSPEVNTNSTITFRLQAPNAKTVRIFTDFPKLGEVPVNGSAGFDMTKDTNGIWSYTSPKLAPARPPEHVCPPRFRRLQERGCAPRQGGRMDDVSRRTA